MPRLGAFTARCSLGLFFWIGLAGAVGGVEDGEDAKKSSWDVSNPPGPTAEVAIDTEEGTWMSVDVSPDGNEIAFDLLGDIYIVTLTGGARALTRGMAWDMQARFSPDGKWIAFTSDRGGGDNIWVMGRDGSDPRAVTTERFRLLNSPTWSPDSQFIAARKHFTSRRSLGAGEIWLYHLNGGAGAKLVARPNDQKDLGEPAFSPDGRFVYFSQDVTPGDVFEYNKDSNAGIYAIRRLDRVTGETERVAGGPGGAIRPTPSPDGEKLAFIRRVRFQSVLFIQDLKSGAERAVYDRLDRDMQEAWAIHGVYPGMAWTPDSLSVVLWAEGKIRRVEVASGEVHTVPFHVKDTRRVVKTLRRKTEVCPETFDVRMLRWVQVDPGGDRVVFQALGHLYTRTLSDGEAKRVTGQDQHFEHYPSFSADGRSIVYTTWDDEDLGRVRVVAATGGEGRVLTRDPGHYVEPVFSGDGRWVVFRKVAGGGLRSPLRSKDTGIYRIPAEGGEAERILGSGSRPHFGAQADRIYFTGRQSGKRSLESIGLFGADRRTHALSENATEFRVSPDGKSLAFVERFGAFVLPLVATGGPLDVGPKMTSLPVKKLSADAGVNLHWSGDSRRIRWSLGPDLFSCDMRKAFAPEPGSGTSESDAGAGAGEAEKQAIGFRQAVDVPDGRLALVGGRVVTMKGDEIIAEGTIIVDANRVAAVGESKTIEVPEGTSIVDVRGLTIFPGLIDVHAHGSRGSDGIIPEQNWRAFSELSFGVTTIHDPSNDTETIFAASEMARAGRIVSPRLFSTGTILYGAAGPFKAEIDSLDDARFHLRRMNAVGAFSVKSYNQPRRDQRQQIIAAARELGMIVVPEGGSLFQMNMSMLVDGHTGIEHCLPVAAVYGDVLDLWSQIEAGYTPTAVVGFGGLSGEYYWYQKTQVWENERLLRFVPRPIIDARSRRRVMAPDEEFNHFNITRICKELSDRGVRVHLGAHGQREGLAAHWEMWMLVQGGMTPLEAFRAATHNGAVYLGMDGDIGSIEVGKLADLIAVEGNPLEDIRDSERVKYTMVNGRLFDSRTLEEIGNHPRKRAKFYFEGGEQSFSAASESVCGCAGGAQGLPR